MLLTPSGPSRTRKMLQELLQNLIETLLGRRQVLEIIAGGVGERLKPPVLKTGVHFVDREFESRPLRQPRFSAFALAGRSHAI